MVASWVFFSLVSMFGRMNVFLTPPATIYKSFLAHFLRFEFPFQLLKQLDGISSSICGVIDAAEFVRSTHASKRWREAAENTFSYCSAYIQELNADTRLHGTLVRLINESGAAQSLSRTQRRFAILLKQEFERDGIHLSAEAQASIGALHSEIIQLETL